MANMIFSEKTLVPVSLVIVLIGAITWLTSMASDIRSANYNIEKVQVKQEQYNATLQEINSRLSKIEGYLSKDKR